jgi:hypothetical protein
MLEVSIDLVHQKVHEGVSYTVNYLEKALVNNGFARLHVKTGAKSAHIIIDVEAEGKMYFRSISEPVVTVNGTGPSDVIAADTKLTLFNRCGVCLNGNKTLVFHTPTFTGGKLRGNRMFPFGTGGTAVGGASQSRIESILQPNASYIIEVQNVSGQTRDVGMVLDWYEVDNG